MSRDLEHSYSIYIKGNPEQVWKGLTSSRFTTQYFPYAAARSDWREGSDYAMTTADGSRELYSGKVLVSDRPRRLVESVNIKFDPSLVGHKEMTITWEIAQFGEACRVTIIHRAADSEAKPFGMLTSHCPDLMSGLKTLLETGHPLHIGDRVEAKA